MTDLTLLGIAEAGRLLARGEITAAALTESFLQRIEAVDHKIASYITVTADLARGRGGAPLQGRVGLRHRRLDPKSRGLLRPRRHQADLRAGQPFRHLSAELQPRHRRAARLDDGGLRANARRAGRARCQRPSL